MWGATAHSLRCVVYRIDFNPRAPCGARPRLTCYKQICYKFQSTRPVWGATIWIFTKAIFSRYFNPRAPCGARRSGTRLHRRAGFISIHAPRVGRDYISALRARFGCHFNPRAPCGARRNAAKITHDLQIFQSTRPVWGATDAAPPRTNDRMISIHAPRVGRDQMDTVNAHSPSRFQSTRPVWGATVCSVISSLSVSFQSTRPVWGATPCGARRGDSRHEAWDGIDVWGATPCGARPVSVFTPSFAFTVWGATPCGARQCRIATPAKQKSVGRDPVWGATANLTILPRQICTKGTKEFLLGRKTHGKKEK